MSNNELCVSFTIVRSTDETVTPKERVNRILNAIVIHLMYLLY